MRAGNFTGLAPINDFCVFFVADERRAVPATAFRTSRLNPA